MPSTRLTIFHQSLRFVTAIIYTYSQGVTNNMDEINRSVCPQWKIRIPLEIKRYVLTKITISTKSSWCVCTFSSSYVTSTLIGMKNCLPTQSSRPCPKEQWRVGKPASLQYMGKTYWHCEHGERQRRSSQEWLKREQVTPKRSLAFKRSLSCSSVEHTVVNARTGEISMPHLFIITN